MDFTLRNAAAGIVSLFLIASGVVRRSRKFVIKEKAILSIYFHNPTRDTFLKCINWLQRKGYTFLSIKDINAVVKGLKPIPNTSVLVTVDDGWKENKKNIVSIANEKKIPVCLFVSTDPVEMGEAYWWSYVNAAHQQKLYQKPAEALKKVENSRRLSILSRLKEKVLLEREALTPEELYEISRSPFITIGSHTVSHPILTMCSEEESIFEITESKKRLESLVHKKVDGFAYPNGDYSEREKKILKTAGYTMAFSTRPLYVTPGNICNCYALPRFEIMNNTSMAENICRMTGVWFLNNPFKRK